MSGWAEGRAACCELLDAVLAGIDRDVVRVDEYCLEGEKVVAGDAGADPAVVLVDAARSTQDFADDVLKVPVGAAAVLEAKVGFCVVKAVGRIADGRVAVDEASHR